MKGVILAGGSGKQLYPAAKVTNKHLLPVFNKPMINYSVEMLKRSGVFDILIIAGTEHTGDFMSLLGSGVEMDVNFTYKIQDGNSGTGHALALAEDFAGDDNIAVVLADNIFEEDFSETIFYFQKGANIFTKKVENPSLFSVVETKEDGTIRSIEDKPNFPKSSLVQTGFYLYDNQVFNFIRSLSEDNKGVLNLTEINKVYLQKKQLKRTKVQGMWADVGSPDGLLEASILVQEDFNPKRKHLSIKEKKEGKEKNSPKVTVGLITYNSEKYIEPCLKTLLNQDYKNFEIIVFDNGSTDNSLKILKEKFAKVKVINLTENVGFSRAHNEILRKTKSDFYACFNIDMIFETNFLSELVRSMLRNPAYGSVGGKLKKWDFTQYKKNSVTGKTNFIDTVGIKIMKSHRFEDIGQGEIDFGQFDKPKDVFGISGAAVLYKREALEDTAFINENNEKEYFDESMFIYKEDVDLAYRLQWAGWHARFTPFALAYHDRTTSSIGQKAIQLLNNREKKSKNINQVSYLNHHILLEKNFSKDFSSSVKGLTWWWNTKVFVYLLIFETETLGQWWKYLKIRKRIKAQRNSMPRRVSRSEIEKFMEA